MDIAERRRWRTTVSEQEQLIDLYRPFGLDSADRPLLLGLLMDYDAFPDGVNSTLYAQYVAREGQQIEACWQQISAKGEDATVCELKMLVRWLRIAKEQAIDLQDYTRLRNLRGYERQALERLTP